MTARSPLDTLAHDRIVAPGASPRRWLVLCHGILGTRANWRGIARRFVRARPTWGAATVDLPGHGDSRAWTASPDARTIDACGAALAATVTSLEADSGATIGAVLGHSFGGKVATAAVGRLVDVGRVPGDLWIVDSPPEPRLEARGITDGVFASLRRLPERFEAREGFVAALVADGIAPPTAQWLAMNLDRGDDGALVFGPKLDHLDALIADFARWDGWPVLHRVSPRVRAHIVIGERSEAYGPGARARALEERARGVVAVDVVPDAGHWVHAEAPAAMLRLLVEAHA